MLNSTYSRNIDHGLPQEADNTLIYPVSDDFLAGVKSGERLQVRETTIECVESDGSVLFSDGSRSHFDAIISEQVRHRVADV